LKRQIYKPGHLISVRNYCYYENIGLKIGIIIETGQGGLTAIVLVEDKFYELRLHEIEEFNV